MKNLIFLLTFLPFFGFGQLGKYDVTVISTNNNPSPGVGNNVQYCVTVDNFNECNVAWFDGLQIILTGATLISYDTRPNSDWRNSNQSTNEPAGWLGWSYNWSGALNQTWNDYGEPGSGPWTFCFTVQITSPTYQIDVAIWSDYDTGGYGSGCGNMGEPDGPYTIAFGFSGLPIELYEFVGDCEGLYWSTVSESHTSHFRVEKSIDGYTWTMLDMYISAAGNSQEMLHYSEEINQREELAYYRLLQYDMDGAYEIFDPIAIYCPIAKIVGIYDMMGRYVGTDTKYLARGAYIILLSNNQTKQIIL